MREEPILYKVGFAKDNVTITKENQSQYPHPISKSYENVTNADLVDANLTGTDFRFAIGFKGGNLENNH